MQRLLVLSGVAMAMLTRLLYGQIDEPASTGSWDKLRAQQPAAPHLKLTLPKATFFQGEKIDATLDFSNDDPKTIYDLATGAIGPGAAFHATDDKGNNLVDPLDWLNSGGLTMINGFVATNKLGKYTLHLSVNENVRYDHPGVYTLYATATVTSEESPPASNPARILIVSDPVSVTITPISSEQEKQAITEALRKIKTAKPNSPGAGPDAQTVEGVTELKDLQTPAARAELIKLLNTEYELAIGGLQGAPDPGAEAKNMLVAAQAGKLVLGPYGVTQYAQLRTCPFSPTAAAAPMTNDTARKEILAAMLQGTPANGTARAEALWTSFQEMWSKQGLPADLDPDGGAARRALAEHQLDLSASTVHTLFVYWNGWGSADFLPLVRREVKAGRNEPYAFIALATLSPDEARPKILAQMLGTDGDFFNGASPLSISPMPMPELDEIFRQRIANRDDLPEYLAPAICIFGSVHILPEVLDYHQNHGTQYPWGSQEEASIYLYWIRCDPEAASANFKKRIQPADDGAWAALGQTLQREWNGTALPLVRIALKDGDAGVAGDAFELLVLRGESADTDPMIAALERQATAKIPVPGVTDHARSFLANSRWQFTDDQRKRLSVLAK